MKQLYYRGVLTSCNYTCGYCPFAKHAPSPAEVLRDQHALVAFTDAVARLPLDERLLILLTPYGEGLIHPHYAVAMARLSNLPQVEAVSVQTNLSIEAETLLERLKTAGAQFHKIKLWATYHPTMTDVITFSQKVNALSKHVDLCAGMVAAPTPEALCEARALRDKLHPSVYLWLNALAKHKRRYTSAQIEALCAIDPFFDYEFNKLRPSPECRAGKTAFFIEADGEIKPCHMVKKNLGHFLKDGLDALVATPTCRRPICDCYLAYNNVPDPRLEQFFGRTLPFRLPEKRAVKALFLDIDGTLCPGGTVNEKTLKSLEYLSQCAKLYFATARSYDNVRRQFRALLPFFSGGVFSNGAHVVDFDAQTDEAPSGGIDLSFIEDAHPPQWRVDSCAGKTVRLVIPAGHAGRLPTVPPDSRMVYDGGKAYLQPAAADKLSGILHLCARYNWRSTDIMTVGDSDTDAAMLAHFPLSVAMPSAPPTIRAHCGYTLDLELLGTVLLCRKTL